MRVFPVLSIFLFALAAGPRAEERSIGSVTVTGAAALSGRAALDAFGLREGETWSAAAESTGAGRLLAEYVRLGLLEAKVTLRAIDGGEGTVDLEIEIDEGRRLPLARVEIEGVEAFSADGLLSRFDTRPGKALSARTLGEDLDRLLRRYGRIGHPFARILITDTALDQEEEGIALTLRIVEGPALRLGEIRVAGNDRTRSSTIRRLSGLSFGGLYDQQSVDASRQRLMRSGLFRTVSEPSVRVDWKEKEAVVEYEVEEARTNRIAGIIGYAPGRDGEEGIFTGFVDLSFRNILGTARSGGAEWRRLSPETRDVRLRYREPWLFGTPFALGGEFEQTLRDSSYSRISGAVTAGVDLSRRVTATFTGRLERMEPRSEGSNVPGSGRRSGGSRFLFDGRDFPGNPTGGLFLRLGAEYGERSIDEDRDRGIKGEKVRQATLEGMAAVFLSIGRRSVAALEVNGLGRFTNDDHVPGYDQFYLGGARTLRGYDEDRFRGSRLAWSRLEWRYLLGALSRVFLFIDTGYIFSRFESGGEIFREEKVKTGYGIGLRADSAIGIVGIDYGLGEGESIAEGKLHVSAEGSF